MHANVEDRGIKGECTPLMEAASAGHLDIVRLLVVHGADVNGQSTSGMSYPLLWIQLSLKLFIYYIIVYREHPFDVRLRWRS